MKKSKCTCIRKLQIQIDLKKKNINRRMRLIDFRRTFTTNEVSPAPVEHVE